MCMFMYVYGCMGGCSYVYVTMCMCMYMSHTHTRVYVYAYVYNFVYAYAYACRCVREHALARCLCVRGCVGMCGCSCFARVRACKSWVCACLENTALPLPLPPPPPSFVHALLTAWTAEHPTHHICITSNTPHLRNIMHTPCRCCWRPGLLCVGLLVPA